MLNFLKRIKCFFGFHFYIYSFTEKSKVDICYLLDDYKLCNARDCPVCGKEQIASDYVRDEYNQYNVVWKNNE